MTISRETVRQTGSETEHETEALTLLREIRDSVTAIEQSLSERQAGNDTDHTITLTVDSSAAGVPLAPKEPDE